MGLQDVDDRVRSTDVVVVPRYRSRIERVLLFLLGVLTAVVVAGHFRPYYLPSAHGFVPDDFGAFYCAGNVVLHRQDPYRVEPLLDCERHIPMKLWGGSIDPAPLPGYDFIPLAALSALPWHLAVLVFGVLLLGATVVTGYSLTRMSALPPTAAFAIAFMGTTYGAVGIGQLAPFTIAAVAAGALLLRLGKPRWAAMAAGATLLQPQVGLPIVVATFLFIPRARLTVAMIIAFLALCSVAAVGIHGVIEYLSVLQIHARSEVNSPIQYSLTWLVHAFGASTETALLAGAVSYIALSSLCLFVLARSRGRAITTGAIILLPAAFAVFGGTYIHHYQISVALLAAIVLIKANPLLMSPMLAAALLVAPFRETEHSTLAALPSLLLAVIAAWCVVFFPTRASTVGTAAKSASLVGILITGLIMLLLAIRPPHDAQPGALVTIEHHANAFASFESQQVSDASAKVDRTPLFYYLLLKLPMWLGVALTLYLSSAILLTSDRRAHTPGDAKSLSFGMAPSTRLP